MEYVWIIRFCEEPDMRVAGSAEKAYEICKDYIRNVAGFGEELKRECLRELEADYERNPEWFACEDVCGAEMIDVEEE